MLPRHTAILLEAYDYIVNGKPALEWIMERYQITIDKASAIKNNPHAWCREHDNPRYIVNLIKRVTRVSLVTGVLIEISEEWETGKDYLQPETKKQQPN